MIREMIDWLLFAYGRLLKVSYHDVSANGQSFDERRKALASCQIPQVRSAPLYATLVTTNMERQPKF